MRKKALVAIAFLAMAILTASCGVLAEETEEQQTDNETVEVKPVTFMFVQTAQSGTFVPVEGEDNLYTLTLIGVAPQTIAFSDRPERVVVQVPMQQFLEGMCFAPENPPNAALEILEADEEEDLAVVELFDPVYDNTTQTLRYNVSILEEPDLSYAVFNERHDRALQETFGPSTLFIDDCPDGHVECCCDDDCDAETCGHIDTGCCWKWGEGCSACHSNDYYLDICREKCGSSYTKNILDCCVPI